MRYKCILGFGTFYWKCRDNAGIAPGKWWFSIENGRLFCNLGTIWPMAWGGCMRKASCLYIYIYIQTVFVYIYTDMTIFHWLFIYKFELEHSIEKWWHLHLYRKRSWPRQRGCTSYCEFLLKWPLFRGVLYWKSGDFYRKSHSPHHKSLHCQGCLWLISEGFACECRIWTRWKRISWRRSCMTRRRTTTRSSPGELLCTKNDGL